MNDREALLLQMSADIRGLQKSFEKAHGIVDAGCRSIENRNGLMVRTLERQMGGVRLPANLRREYQQLGVDIGRGLSDASRAAQVALLGVSAYAIKLAMDAGEIESAFDVAFKGSAKSARDFSNVLTQKVGRDSVETREAMTRLQLVLTGTGVAADQAAEMVKRLSEVAIDSGSLFNTSDAEAYQKIISGLSGEAEPLKAFGVVLTEAAVKAELLRLGFKGNKEEASEAAKSIARANLIIQGLAVAQGDAERTADSAANQTRRMRAEFNAAARDLGNELLPAFIQVTKGATDTLRAFSDLPGGVQVAGLAILAFIAAGGPIAGLLANLARVIKLAKETRAAIAGIAVANAAAGATGVGAAGAGLAGPAAGGLGLGVGLAATSGVGLILGGAGLVIASPGEAKATARNPGKATDEKLRSTQHALQQTLERNAANASYPLMGFGTRAEAQKSLDAVTAELMKRGKASATAAVDATTDNPATVQGGFSLTPEQMKGNGGGAKAKTAKAKKDPRDLSDERSAQIAAQVQAAEQDVLQATLDLAINVEARADIEKKIIAAQAEEEAKRLDAQIAALKDAQGLDDGKKKELIAQLEIAKAKSAEAADLRTQAVDREAAERTARDALDLRLADLDTQLELASLTSDMATTAKDRRAAEHRILDLVIERERIELEGIVASKAASDAEKERARRRLASLDEIKEGEGRRVDEGTRGPWEEYVSSLPRTADEVNERLENLAVNGMQAFEDAIVSLADGTQDAGDVVRSFVRQALAEFTRLNVQRLFGAATDGGGGGSGAGSFLMSALSFGASMFGGGSTPGYASGSAMSASAASLNAANSAFKLQGFADGTDFAPGGLSLVGERGPELLNIPRGSQVIPNETLRGIVAGGRAGQQVYSPTLHQALTFMHPMSAVERRQTVAQASAAAAREMSRYRKSGIG